MLFLSYIYFLYIGSFFCHKNEPVHTHHQDNEAELKQFLCSVPGTHRPSLHLWWCCSCRMESPCANPPASSGNLPHTGGSQTWLLIKMTGRVLTIYRCLGPNYQETLIPVSLVCYSHDWVLQISTDSFKVKLELRRPVTL